MTEPTATKLDEGALMPCPFCGGEAVEGDVDNEDSDEHGGHFIHCTNNMCGASTNLRFSLKEDARPILREMWNRREPSPAWPPEIVAAIAEMMHMQKWRASQAAARALAALPASLRAAAEKRL